MQLVASRIDSNHRKHMIKLLNTYLTSHIKFDKTITISRSYPSLGVSQLMIIGYINN